VEPISSASGRTTPWLRPVGGAPELATILREGRVLAGEVLQTLHEGTILIGVGRHRIAATSDTQLRPGARHLFEVLSEGEPLQVRVVPTAGEGADDELLRALRTALAAEQPLGSMLESLAAVLERELRGAPERRAALQRLLDALGGRALRPGAGGGELAAALKSGGLAYEARLADLALRSSASALDEFAALARAAFAEELGGDGAADELGAALRRLVASERAPTSATELARRLGAALELAAARAGWSGGALARVRGLGVDAWPQSFRRALVRALAGGGADAQAGPVELESAAAELARDFKAELLRARAELEPGAARAAVERALANLEAEQLLNVARGASHEPLQWSLPLRDGERWTTAHLYVRRDGSGRRGPASGEGRLALAVEFSSTGPVHADVLLGSGGVALRILVSSDEVAARLRERLPDLEQHLAFGGRAVRASLATAPEEQLRAEDGVRDLDLLRDRSVMDLLG
jgi:hypothetical protein